MSKRDPNEAQDAYIYKAVIGGEFASFGYVQAVAQASNRQLLECLRRVKKDHSSNNWETKVSDIETQLRGRTKEVSQEQLVTCPGCGIPNFTKRGLKAHRCKGSNRPESPSMKKQKAKSVAVEVVSDKKQSDLALRQHMANALAFHQLSKNCAQYAVLYAARSGAELIQAKEACGHGQFMKWVNKHLPSIGHQCANRYMSLAEGLQAKIKTLPNYASVRNLNLLDLPDPRDLKSVEHSKVARAVQKISDGKTVTQLYLDLGIVKPRKTKSSVGTEKVRQATAALAGQVDTDKTHMAALARVWVDDLEEQFSPDRLRDRIREMHEDDINRFVTLLRSTLSFLGEK